MSRSNLTYIERIAHAMRAQHTSGNVAV